MVTLTVMESDYVRRCVGQALALGLAEVGALRPADPVEYLALWLLQHKRNLDEKDVVGTTLFVYFFVYCEIRYQKLWQKVD